MLDSHVAPRLVCGFYRVSLSHGAGTDLASQCHSTFTRGSVGDRSAAAMHAFFSFSRFPVEDEWAIDKGLRCCLFPFGGENPERVAIQVIEHRQRSPRFPHCTLFCLAIPRALLPLDVTPQLLQSRCKSDFKIIFTLFIVAPAARRPEYARLPTQNDHYSCGSAGHYTELKTSELGMVSPESGSRPHSPRANGSAGNARSSSSSPEVVAVAEGGQRRLVAVRGQVAITRRRGPAEGVDGPVGQPGQLGGRRNRSAARGDGRKRGPGAGQVGNQCQVPDAGKLLEQPDRPAGIGRPQQRRRASSFNWASRRRLSATRPR